MVSKISKMDSGDRLWELLGVGYDTHGMVYEWRVLGGCIVDK
jgi:hypothetical protein